MAGLESQDPPLLDLLLRGFPGPLIPQRESPPLLELWEGHSTTPHVSYDPRAGQSRYETSQAYRASSQPQSRPLSTSPTKSTSRPPPAPYMSDTQYHSEGHGHSQPDSNEQFIGNRPHQQPVSAPSWYFHQVNHPTWHQSSLLPHPPITFPMAQQSERERVLAMISSTLGTFSTGGTSLIIPLWRRWRLFWASRILVCEETVVMVHHIIWDTHHCGKKSERLL